MKSKAHGYLFALAATTIFSLQDAVSKHLGDHYSPIFITMIRYWAFGALDAFCRCFADYLMDLLTDDEIVYLATYLEPTLAMVDKEQRARMTCNAFAQ